MKTNNYCQLGETPSIDLSGYLGLEESSGVKTKLRLEDLQWSLADVWCPFGAAPHGQAVLAHCGPFGSHGDIGQQCEAITGDGSGLTSLPGKVECLLPSALPVVIFTSAQLISGCPQLWALGYNSCQPFVDGSELHFIAKAQKSGVKGLTVTIRLVEVLPTIIKKEAFARHLGEVGWTNGNGFLAGHQVKLTQGQTGQCETN